MFYQISEQERTKAKTKKCLTSWHGPLSEDDVIDDGGKHISVDQNSFTKDKSRTCKWNSYDLSYALRIWNIRSIQYKFNNNFIKILAFYT